MSNNDFYSIGLSISDGTNKYRLATIQFDSKKEELFYHFSFLRKYNNALIYNNNTLIEKGNIDHVTFHNSGQIHYRHKKHKSGEYKWVEKKLENNMFYSLAEYGFFPLCINSLNLGKSDYIDKLPIYKKKENEFEIECPNNEQLTKLSISLFICKTIDAYNGIKVYLEDFKMDVLMPPNDKQMNIWFDSLNIHRFAISGQDFKIIDAFNGWKIIPIFSKYVIKKDKSKKIEGQEFMSFGLFPPKKIFIDSNFGEIFEI